MKESMQLRENGVTTVLVRARRLLARPYGWTKQEKRRKTRGKVAYCALGAIEQATARMPKSRRDGAELAAIHELSCAVPGLHLISDWNDDPLTRKADVLNIFDAAIRESRRP